MVASNGSRIADMKSKSSTFYFLANCFCLGICPLGWSQEPQLFERSNPIEITIQTNLGDLMSDRGDNPQYHSAVISYRHNDAIGEIPLKIKTRGHFRKMASNCDLPPLLLNFKKSATPKSSPFHGLDKVKLVTPCKNDELVFREFLVYKIYNLLTPESFKVQMLKITFLDSMTMERTENHFAFLIEEETEMAKRNNAKIVKRIGLNASAIKKEKFLRMAVFQFLIGNTDWSIQYRQNIKLILPEGDNLPTAVPYDFDHAGLVRAKYAKPAPELNLRSTIDRRYRGYCLKNLDELIPTFEIFNLVKKDVYALYVENPHLDEKYISKTEKFLDEFYSIINNPKKTEYAFSYPCDRDGTGHIVIKGLKDSKN